MKIKLTILSSLLISVLTNAAPLRGPSSGGGGFAVSCAQNPVEPASTTLLDLFEGGVQNNFVMAKASGDIVEDTLAAADRVYTIQGHPDLAEQRKDAILQNLRGFFRNVRFVGTPAELTPAWDLGTLPQIPSSCKLEQVAYFHDSTGQIDVLRPLWEKMDSLSQAALLDHELFYREYRIMGDRTSQLARRATYHAYATQGPTPLTDGLNSGSREFSAYPDVPGSGMSSFNLTRSNSPAGLWSLEFTQIQGRPQLTRTYTEFPAYAWSFELGRSKADPKFTGCILTTEAQDVVLEVPVHGTMLEGFTLKVSFKTGEPIRFQWINQGQVLGSEYVDGGQGCQGRNRN